MFVHFRSFFVQGSITGGLYVSPISAVALDGYSPLITAGSPTAPVIGTVEPLEGNTDSKFDSNTNSNLPVTVRLFGPTRNAPITGIPTAGVSAGSVVYLAVSGFVTLVTSFAGQVAAGVTLQSALNNGDIIEIAAVL